MSKALDFVEAALAESEKRTDGEGRILTSSETTNHIRGIEIPWMALRYLLHSSVIPLGVIMGTAAEKGSLKSALGFFLSQIFMNAGGLATMIETENKYNPLFAYSFMYDEFKPLYMPVKLKTLEEAQAYLSAEIKRYKKLDRKDRFPFLITLDSIAGAPPEAAVKAIEKDGYASKRYAEAALLWSSYFKKLSSDLLDLDVLIYFTNHLKEKMQEGRGAFQAKQYTKQGGTAQDFHAMHYIYVRRIGKIDLANREGKLLQFSTDKCGMGPDSRKIVIPAVWKFVTDPETGETRQLSTFAMDEATARLFAGVDGNVKIPARVNAYLKEIGVRCEANRYHCTALGVPKKSPLDGNGMGALLNSNTEIQQGFQQACGFNSWKDISTGPVVPVQSTPFVV